ncbi:hypothetical protein V6N13_086562 [Hibiscus sabdariffa]
MGKSVILHLVFGVLAVLGVSLVNAEDPYLFFTWTVTYGTRSILGVPQQALQQSLDTGNPLPFPDGVLINGQTQSTFSGDQGRTYMFRISNVGLSTSLNFRIQETVLTATGVLHYANSNAPVSGPIPAAPVNQFDWSMEQARTYSFGSGQWSPDSRKSYNLVDALTRHTTQVYPNSWTAIFVSLDNQALLTNTIFPLTSYSAAKLSGVTHSSIKPIFFRS